MPGRQRPRTDGRQAPLLPKATGNTNWPDGATERSSPPVCCRRPNHYRRLRRAKAEAMVERVTEHRRPQLGIGAVKRALLAIEVHRHRSLPTLDRHGIYGWLDLAAADRAPPAERELAVDSWVASKRWTPAWLHKAARSRRPQRSPRWMERLLCSSAMKVTVTRHERCGTQRQKGSTGCLQR
jgi:hypothetical protein